MRTPPSPSVCVPVAEWDRTPICPAGYEMYKINLCDTNLRDKRITFLAALPHPFSTQQALLCSTILPIYAPSFLLI